jgi:glycosyltransferase involved in cell wall biosynthesis
MRVLIYTHVFPPNVGGVETYARLLSEGLAKQTGSMGTEKIDVTVVTHTPADSGYDAQFSFPVVRQPGLFRLLKLIRSATVVQLAGPSLLPMVFAFLLRKPFVIEHHGYQAICPNGLLLYEPTKEVCPGHFMARRYGRCLTCNRKLLGWRKSVQMLVLTFLRRRLCRHAESNIAVTSHVARRLELPATRVVYHGIPDLLPADSVLYAHAISGTSEPVCFSYVGRLVSEKGLLLLVQAANLLRNQGYSFNLKLIGDGPEREKLQAEVARWGLQMYVTFTGFLTGDKLNEALSGAGAVVMPSIWEETAGLAAIEQMFRARLVIASDIGGLGEVVGETGLKFPAGDIGALTNCMRQVLDKPDIVSKFGQRARLRALTCFGLGRMLNEHIDIYRTSYDSGRL